MAETAPVTGANGPEPLPDGVANPFGPANPGNLPSQFAQVLPDAHGGTGVDGSTSATPGTGADGGAASPDVTDTTVLPALNPGDTLAMPAVSDTGTPETSTAESKDTAARYEDVVLLNRSYRVRRKIHEGSTQSIKGWQWSKATLANGADIPGKLKRDFAHWRAELSLGRKQNRLAMARNSVQWQARNAKVEAARQRVDQRRLDRDRHEAHMDKRKRDVSENAEHREQQYIEELKVRKQNALLRKTVRQESDLSRYRRRDRRELEEMMRIIPAERLDAIAKVAIESQTTTYLRERAEKTERWAKKRHSRTQGSVTRIGDRIREYEAKVTEADEKVLKIDEVTLPEARERVRALREELSKAGDDEEARTRLTAQLEEAEGEVNGHVESLAEWRKVASKNRGKSGRATKRSAGMQQKLDRRRNFADAASERVKQWHETELDDQDTLHDEVVVTLGPRRTVAPHNPDEERKAA